ncbi:MAG TPA: HAD hydrolase-like protein [Bacteroidia bacterium]|jgi:putative hydrolase of the HAD superfamily|nr:HAD hydrolase-like protein [Bacteroidia bacterium]
MSKLKITTLFLDIGGVLLTNGWGRDSRNKAITHFRLNAEEVNERHHLTFDTYEEGKLTLSEYLHRVVFYEPRKFSEGDFTAFMFKQSLPYTDTISFFKKLKTSHGLKIVAVSNEGRELNNYRIKKYKLSELFDAFVSSSFVHLRKPDADIFRMASDIAQTATENSLYIDDRLMFVEVARKTGMHGLHYEGLPAIKKQLKRFGLTTS